MGSSGTLILSKVLSLGVVAGALVGKMPQVHKIWQARSAEGVSVASIWTEATSNGIQLAYNVVRRTPLTTFGEVPIIFMQLILLGLVAAWAEKKLQRPQVWLGAFLLVFATAAMCLHLIPASVTTTAYAFNALIQVAVVLPQLLMNRRRRSTGQLSFVVVAMTLSGLTTRLFTTLVEVDDLALRLTIALNWLLWAMLMSQFWLYRTGNAADKKSASFAKIVPMEP